jgi:hypothetical protein
VRCRLILRSDFYFLFFFQTILQYYFLPRFIFSFFSFKPFCSFISYPDLLFIYFFVPRLVFISGKLPVRQRATRHEARRRSLVHARGIHVLWPADRRTQVRSGWRPALLLLRREVQVG